MLSICLIGPALPRETIDFFFGKWAHPGSPVLSSALLGVRMPMAAVSTKIRLNSKLIRKISVPDNFYKRLILIRCV